MRRHDAASSTSPILADPNSAARPVHFKTARVWPEPLHWIFGCDSKLNGAPMAVNCVLRYAKLRKRHSTRDGDLRFDEIEASDLFRNGVLDLNSRVDLNLVIAIMGTTVSSSVPNPLTK